ARINTITMDFETVAKHGDGVCSIEETLSLGNIALFQFIAFSEHGMDLSDCTTTKVEGRVHVNGDFCGGCGNELYAKIERLTASGSVFKKNNCSRYNSTSTDFINFKDKGTPDWVLLTKDATDSNWHNLAIQMFGGNVQDKSHGVPELKVPFVAQPEMQPGKDEQRNEHSNEDSMRFYVDPPGIYEDDAISEERLAWKADIRIIDGVWYKNDGTFPGKPIWSDHPGKAKTV
ncbi:MAG: hypothetical protein GY822_12070, partial [Deltaproteobacteria bacterium]|nr:hypothetical protein [Deltaproteobacteria bacterium]